MRPANCPPPSRYTRVLCWEIRNSQQGSIDGRGITRTKPAFDARPLSGGDSLDSETGCRAETRPGRPAPQGAPGGSNTGDDLSEAVAANARIIRNRHDAD